jgi:phosphoribosyl-AMP cyclohydrolase
MSTYSELDSLKFNDQGLIPAIAQDALSGRVLMLAWMNRESLQKTLELGEAVYFSRSRNELWQKGATSGNRQAVESISYDCDADSLLLLVKPAGPACHTGETSCFDAGVLDLEKR